MQSIGILGVGELTEKVVRGLRSSGFDGEILLSPRNRERALALADECACQVLADNAQVARQAQLLIVGVRPVDLGVLAGQISLQPGQWLLSLVAGVDLATLRELFPDARCARLMLSYAAQFNASTVVLSPPADELHTLLAGLGTLVPLADEQHFELATVAACMNGWFYFLLHDLQQWLETHGMPAAEARQLVIGSVKDCLTCAEQQGGQSLRELGLRIATPGTYTAGGLAVLEERQVSAQLAAACQHVLNALTARH